MNVAQIDEAIDRYVSERMTADKERAVSRFLTYVHLRCNGRELKKFMQQINGMARYYIDLTKVLENPFRGVDMAHLATIVVVMVASICLINNQDTRASGIIICFGTIVQGWCLLKHMVSKWRESGVMIAIYEEIAALAEQEALLIPQ